MVIVTLTGSEIDIEHAKRIETWAVSTEEKTRILNELYSQRNENGPVFLAFGSKKRICGIAIMRSYAEFDPIEWPSRTPRKECFRLRWIANFSIKHYERFQDAVIARSREKAAILRAMRSTWIINEPVFAKILMQELTAMSHGRLPR